VSLAALDPACASPTPRRTVRASLARALAMALLPASIVPVLLAGPALVRAPHTLWRQISADVQRLERSPRSR
jgi:hypothetical protein